MSSHKLPNEVLAETFFHIEARTTLFNVSLCSRRFHEIAEPALYKLFRNDHEIDLILFLRTILQNPRLGSHVRTFNVHDRRYSTGIGRTAAGLDCFGQDDWIRLRTAIRSASPTIHQVEPWVRSFYTHHWDAIIALMLVLLPRLEYLGLELSGNCWEGGQYDHSRYFLTNMILSCGWGDFPYNPEAHVYLKNLKQIDITPYDTEMPICMQQFLSYLKVKSVTTVNIEFLEIPQWERIDFNCLSAKNLKLTYSGLAPRPFRILLECFPNLERLYYEHDGVVASQFPLQPVLVGRALAHLKHSLRELILIDENPVTVDNLFLGAADMDIERDDIGPIGTLADYTKLEVLNTMYHILITPYYNEEDNNTYYKEQDLASALPPSIRSLTVQYCPEEFIGHIHELLNHIERFPRLKHFTAIFDRSGAQATMHDSLARSLQEKAVKHGVSLELRDLGVRCSMD